MAWDGNNCSTSHNSSRNYMYQDKVFLLDAITDENCAFLIGDLSTFVLAKESAGKRLTFIINSPGGDAHVMMTILGLINIAKLNNIEITTFVMGSAGSAASIIAVQGDQRFITRVSTHFVHFGCMWNCITKDSEIEKIYRQSKKYSANIANLYISACDGKLTKDMLDSLQSDERGYLSAEECVQYGLCDAILEDDLDTKQILEKERLEFEEGFEDYLKEKQKQAKEEKRRKKAKNNK